MATIKRNLVSLFRDIAGHDAIDNARSLTVDEASYLGKALSGQTGAAASITALSGGLLTLTGLTGMTAESIENVLTISGAASGGNNGTFRIAEYISATSVKVSNPSGVAPDANNGAITWTERRDFSAMDHVDFDATDRKNIKGTASHTTAVPTYQRPTAVGTNVPANLTNIASKTLDAHAWLENRKYENQAVSSSNAAATGSITTIAGASLVDGETFTVPDGINTPTVFEFDSGGGVSGANVAVPFTAGDTASQVRDSIISAMNGVGASYRITASNGGASTVNLVNDFAGAHGNTTSSETVANGGFVLTNMTGGASNTFARMVDAGNLKHADAVDRTGLPIQDGADAGDDESTYVEIINPATAAALEVLAGPQIGNRIYGRMRAGSTGVSPDSVEVEFRSVADGAPLSAGVAYTWEAGHPTVVDLFFGYNQRLDLWNRNANRRTLVHGIVGDANTAQDINDIRTTIGSADGDTHLSSYLTNTGNFFPFVNLPDATPSVVEALNTLNAQIGNRTYTGGILTSGQTLTASLQALSTAIAASSVVRYIERLTADIPPNTAHTLTGGATYTIDGTFNGLYLWVNVAGLRWCPGPVADVNGVTGNRYAETSITSITPYERVKAKEILDIYILA